MRVAGGPEGSRTFVGTAASPARRGALDLGAMKGRRNPYIRQLKKQITIRIGVDVLDYFRGLAEETGIPYQNLIDMYLRDCVVSRRRPSLKWVS